MEGKEQSTPGQCSIDLDVGSGGGLYEPRPLGDVNLDIDKPKIKPRNFIVGDAQNLPFKNSSFRRATAHNVLEHVNDPWKAMNELRRVAIHVHIRQDKILSFANYATPDHYWFQLPKLRFVRYPRTWLGIRFSQLAREWMTGPAGKWHGRLRRMVVRSGLLLRHYEVEIC